MNETLNKEIRYLKGVGPKRAEAFARLGINTVGDLLRYYPRTYEDRTKVKPIAELEPGEKTTVYCMITNLQARRIRKGMHIIKAYLHDDSGQMEVIWFNQEYYYKKLENGKKYWFYGKIEQKGFLMGLTNPIFSEKFDDFALIVPVYGKNKDLTQNIIRKCMLLAMDEWDLRQDEIFPEKILNEYGLANYGWSIRNIHYPVDNNAFHAARGRLVFQEFFLLQAALLLLKSRHRAEHFIGKPFVDFKLGDEYINSLPFEMTGAQKRVIGEIRKDFSSGIPMHRLVQGDVGSGKTAVAAAAVADACQNGYQSAFMAPTEILAHQHYDSLKDELCKIGINVEYLGGDLKSKEKTEVYEKLTDGSIDLIIGTHALIQKKVEFRNLGLIITDEQHRFGVEQRKTLAGKGDSPHNLVLTATPIPRTLAIILYGDLDISVIDEMPPGRKSIETYPVTPKKRRRILDFAEKQMSEGRQVYYVCPRIDEDGDDGLMSAEAIYNELSAYYGNRRVGLVHGKMKAKEKEAAMLLFYSGEMDLLVSTTVIEVGVNVPNAALMIIDNAERFGLSQLHQLRGRVGRGHSQSYCIMINRGMGKIAARRMEIMAESSDGFYISEQDLLIRGPGEFFGTRQHGLPEFKIANIYEDMTVLHKAREAAVKVLGEDPELLKPENANIMVETKGLLAGWTPG